MKLRGSTQQPPRNGNLFVLCARCHAASSMLSGCDTLAQCWGVVLLNANKKRSLTCVLRNSSQSWVVLTSSSLLSSRAQATVRKGVRAAREAVLKIEGLCFFLFVFWWKEGVLNLSAAQIYPSVFQPSPELHRAASGVWFVKSPLSLFALFLVRSAC